jgi:hypothetical protein
MWRSNTALRKMISIGCRNRTRMRDTRVSASLRNSTSLPQVASSVLENPVTLPPGFAPACPRAKVEAIVLDAVRRHIGHDAPLDNTELITTYVRQIEVRRTVIAISLLREDHASEDEKDNPLVSTARLGGEDASYLVPMLISRNINGASVR